MRQQFNALQIETIMGRSAKSPQCACPAQVCGTIVDLRELYDYQMSCLNNTPTDRLMHEAIAQATVRAHDIMEECLKEILETEGWDMQTLTPERPLQPSATPPDTSKRSKHLND